MLIGVMRFLQTEWHRHERDRNAWEIERAEMKSRIGRLEGDARKSKKTQESLGKYIKILESALRQERERTKSLSNGEKVEVQRDPKEVARENLKAASKCRAHKLNRLARNNLMHCSCFYRTRKSFSGRNERG